MSEPQRRSTDTQEHRRAILMPKLVAIITAGLLAGSLVVAGLALVQTSSNGNRTCAAALRVRDAVVAVFADAQQRSRADPAQTETEKQREAASDFFNRSLGTLRAVGCPK